MERPIDYKDTILREIQDKFLWEVDIVGILRNLLENNQHFVARVDDHISSFASIKEFTAYFLCYIVWAENVGILSLLCKRYIDLLDTEGRVSDCIELTNYVFKALMLAPHLGKQTGRYRIARVAAELHLFTNLRIHSKRRAAPNWYQLGAEIDESCLAIETAHELERAVVVLVSEKYLAALELWLSLYKRFMSRDILLVIGCIGRDIEGSAASLAKAAGVPHYRLINFNVSEPIQVCGNGMNLDFIWYIKISLIQNLVRIGFEVIYSDLDAYWIRDIACRVFGLASTQSFDLIVSTTGDVPQSAVLDWGFTPCAGFFYCNRSNAAKEFMDRWRYFTEVMFDDQIALATLIESLGGWWSPSNDLEIDNTLEGSIFARLPKIGVIHQRIVRRNNDVSSCDESTEVWHPRWIESMSEMKGLLSTLPSSCVKQSS